MLLQEITNHKISAKCLYSLLERGLAQPITLESSFELMPEAYLEPTPTWIEIFLHKHLIRAN